MAEASATTTYHLTDRVVLIPGGLGPVGRAVTLAFLGAGATVVAVGASAHSAEIDEIRSQAGEAGERFSYRVANVLDEAEVESLVLSVTEDQHHLDVLVNLVGGWSAGQPVTGLELATWERMLNLNATAAFLLAKHAARPMVQQHWGRIIHVSSRGARAGRRNAAAYAISKNAELMLTEIQAEELREANVTVNAILPSIVDTEENRGSMPNADFSRWPKAHEIARVLLFLASDDSGLISGASIPVYGMA